LYVELFDIKYVFGLNLGKSFICVLSAWVSILNSLKPFGLKNIKGKVSN